MTKSIIGTKSLVVSPHVKPVEMDVEMNHLVRKIADEKNISYQDIVSGAGHDAQVFGTMCPTCLLFVPSQGGNQPLT
ncbi:hypothetical protein [Peribacillus butanolivorans]|uniref:hypothetical protein n=1 Tax=Peribacillus butanolivorans TaxID=421767 RepID=UPI00366CAA19